MRMLAPPTPPGQQQNTRRRSSRAHVRRRLQHRDDAHADDAAGHADPAEPFVTEYDLGGTIWGGSRFTWVKGDLYFNRRLCMPWQPHAAGY